MRKIRSDKKSEKELKRKIHISLSPKAMQELENRSNEFNTTWSEVIERILLEKNELNKNIKEYIKATDIINGFIKTNYNKYISINATHSNISQLTRYIVYRNGLKPKDTMQLKDKLKKLEEQLENIHKELINGKIDFKDLIVILKDLEPIQKMFKKNKRGGVKGAYKYEEDEDSFDINDEL